MKTCRPEDDQATYTYPSGTREWGTTLTRPLRRWTIARRRGTEAPVSFRVSIGMAISDPSGEKAPPDSSKKSPDGAGMLRRRSVFRFATRIDAQNLRHVTRRLPYAGVGPRWMNRP